MRPSWPAELATLVRAPNLLIAAFGVAVGGALASGRVSFPPALVLAMLSAAGIGAAGYVANDLWDVEADRVNRPRRPLASGRLPVQAALATGGVLGGLGLLAAWWVGGDVFRIGLAAVSVMLAYSPLLKPVPVLGNLVVAVVASVPLLYGAAAVGSWRGTLIPFVLAALLHLGREVVKDLDDVRGDIVAGRRTIPVTWGRRAGFVAATVPLAAFVPVALAPWFAGTYGSRYGAAAVVAALVAAAVVARLLREQSAGASTGVKLAMVAGLLGLLWDRL